MGIKISSITMTVFYIILMYIWQSTFPEIKMPAAIEAIIWISYGKDGCGYPYILWLLYSGNFIQQNKTKGRSVNDSKDLCIYVDDCNQVDRFIFYRNLPDFLVKKTLHKQLTFDKKYVCFKITNSARYEWGSRYGKRKERETDT
jgi:hypothetical protein